MKSSKGYFYYFVWMLGALLLLYYGSKFTGMMESKTKTFYQMEYTLIGEIVYALVFGLYLSCLNGLPNRRKFNRPLLTFVFIPSFLLVIYPIITIYVKQIYIVGYYQLIQEPQFFFLGMLSGYSLVKSVFTTR